MFCFLLDIFIILKGRAVGNVLIYVPNYVYLLLLIYRQTVSVDLAVKMEKYQENAQPWP